MLRQVNPKNESSLAVNYLHVVRHLQKLKIYSIISNEWNHSGVAMPNVFQQEWPEVWSSFFCIWLDIHRYVHFTLDHSYGCGQTHLVMALNFEPTMLFELSNDFNYLHISIRHPQKQQIDSVISSGLKVTPNHALCTFKKMSQLYLRDQWRQV